MAAKLKFSSEESEKLKSFMSDVARSHGQTELAKQIDSAPNSAGVINMLAQSTMNSTQLDTGVSNLFVFIAEQQITNESVKKIFGDVFELLDTQEESTAGGGISIITQVQNGAGISAFPNYQTSTNPVADILFGSSVSNSVNQINFTLNYLQSATIALTDGTENCAPYYPRVVINKTIPMQYAQFAVLSPIKMQELLNNYAEDTENSAILFKYKLGLSLFGTFAPRLQMEVPTGTTYTSIYEYMQLFFLPQLIKMCQNTEMFNGGDTAPGNNTGSEMYTQYPGGVNFNRDCYTNSVQQQSKKEDLIMLMSPTMSATLVSLLNMPNFANANASTFKLEATDGMITSLGGIKVIVTGTSFNLSQQSPQGTPITIENQTGQVMPDNQIWVVDRHYLQWKKVYAKKLNTGDMANAMVDLVRYQIFYTPILKAGKTACKFIVPENLISTVAKLPISMTGGTAS